jgi:hypothetical protein
MTSDSNGQAMRTILCHPSWVGADDKGVFRWQAPDPTSVRGLVAEVSRRSFDKRSKPQLGSSAHARLVAYAAAMAADCALIEEGAVEVWWNGVRLGLDDSLTFSDENTLVFVQTPSQQPNTSEA